MFKAYEVFEDFTVIEFVPSGGPKGYIGLVMVFNVLEFFEVVVEALKASLKTSRRSSIFYYIQSLPFLIVL